MDIAGSMALKSSLNCHPLEEVPPDAKATGLQQPADQQPVRRRRLSSFGRPRSKSLVNQIIDSEENLLLKLDEFLSELEKRFEKFESYGETTLDASLARAYATLQAVRTRCSHVSEGMLGASRRRLQVLVDTLEIRCQEALAAAGSLNEKARVGIELLDAMLADFETQASKFRERSVANAVDAADAVGQLMDEGLERAHKVVDESLERAKWAAGTLEEHIQQAMARARQHGLLHYEDLPVPWRINPHILRGYRFSESKSACFHSMFRMSNELVNIWSHGLGVLLVLAVAFYLYPTSVTFHLSTKTDVFIAATFFFAACQCLVCSTIWHTMNSIADANLISSLACVDYTGISLLVAASIMTTEYTAFYCDPISRWVYMSTTAFLGIGGVALPWHPFFNRADMAWARVAFYVGLSATGFLPLLQISMTRGMAFVWEFYLPITKSLLVYMTGACVYASKVPERWWPGMFDYIGGSHNLWHVAVLGGILFHYTAMQEFFSNAFRRAQDGCPTY